MRIKMSLPVVLSAELAPTSCKITVPTLLERGTIDQPESKRRRIEVGRSRQSETGHGWHPGTTVQCAHSACIPEELQSNVGEQIGKGAQGTVHELRGAWKGCVLKSSRNRKGCGNIKREAIILEKLQHHPGISELRWHGEWENKYAMVIPDAGVSCEAIMSPANRDGSELTLAKEMIRQLTKALRWLLTKRYMHRDVGPANVCYKIDGRRTQRYAGAQVTLIDFGLGERWQPHEESTVKEKDFIGTLLTAAPRMHLGRKLEHPLVDGQSLAMTALAVICPQKWEYHIAPTDEGQSERELIKQVGRRKLAIASDAKSYVEDKWGRELLSQAGMGGAIATLLQEKTADGYNDEVLRAVEEMTDP